MQAKKRKQVAYSAKLGFGFSLAAALCWPFVYFGPNLYLLRLKCGKVGLLDYQQLLSGPDQVHRPYNTSYLTNFMTLPHCVITRLPGIDGPLSLAFSAL